MSKKKIEDVANDVLKDDAQRNALEFIAYLRANEVTLNDSDNGFWDATYKGEGLCVINIATYDDHSSFDTFIKDLPNAWKMCSDGKKSDECSAFFADERTKEIIWANIRPHDPTCHGACRPGSRRIILGKVFENLCSSALGIYGPDAETVNCMKKIVNGLQSDILQKVSAEEKR
ncbi:MAG: hypothetical protein FWE88_07595 [Phycisphaerae bacterium]|nr:hypothetical protein [Phycisphaerae bacterium]